jgi:hypothetical protein
VSEGGIPMIDQDGRPRPVEIKADAGITVEGTNNVVGTERGVVDVLTLRHAVCQQKLCPRQNLVRVPKGF